jgi:NADH:ubiquinone oxidoreductase subunit 3 (subunit A)
MALLPVVKALVVLAALAVAFLWAWTHDDEWPPK